MHSIGRVILAFSIAIWGIAGVCVIIFGYANVLRDRGPVAAAQSEPEAASCTDKKILFVAGILPVAADEAQLIERLESRGFIVDVRSQNEASVQEAQASDLVVVSESIFVSSFTTKFRSVSVAVLTWEAFLYPHMGMVGPEAGTDFGIASDQTAVVIDNAAHPLAAGQSGTVETHAAPSAFHWAQPSSSALKVAHLAEDSGKYAILAYESGVMMHDIVAPARRIGMHSGTLLTDSGLLLFDAAAAWGASCTAESEPPSPNTFLLHLEVEGKGVIEVDPLKSAYNPGDLVILEAIAADGWVFERWEGATLTDFSPTVIVFVDQDETVKAIFIPEPPTSTPTATPTVVISPTVTQIPTPSFTATLTPTATSTFTPTVVITPTATETQSPTITPQPTATATPEPTFTFTPSRTATPTETPSSTPTVTFTATATSTPENTATQSPPATATPSPTVDIQVSNRDFLLVDADGNNQFSVGDTLVYVITVQNRGSRPVTDIQIETLLDEHVKLQAGTVSAGQGVVVKGNQAGDETVIVRLEVLGAGGTTEEVRFQALIEEMGEKDQVESSAVVTIGSVAGSAEGMRISSDDPDTIDRSGDPTITALGAAVRRHLYLPVLR